MSHPSPWRPLVLGLLVLTTSSPAFAQGGPNPFEAEQRRLAEEVRRAGSAPRAILPLIELDHG